MSGKQPVVSVIVPVYNVERFLPRCVESALLQTFTDFELLLVDDGSKDSSGIICDAYAVKDTRVRVIHKANGGASSARNLGLDAAQGEWILFLDGDDYWTSDECLSMLLERQAELQVDILRFEYQAVDEQEALLFTPSVEKKKAWAGRRLTESEFYTYALAGENFIPLLLIRKSLIGNLRFDKDYVFLEDMHFLLHLLSSRRFTAAYIEPCLYAYRKHVGSQSHCTNLNNIKYSFLLCDEFDQAAERVGDGALRQSFRYNAVMMYYWTLATVADENYYPHRSQIIHDFQVDALQKRTLRRVFRYRQFNFYFPFIVCLPSLGLQLIRMKNRLMSIQQRLMK